MSEADIDLGTVTRNEMADPAIAEAAFKLEKDKVSEPVTGKLGSVVLLRVTEIEPGKIPTFEEAKAEIEKRLLKDRASGAIFDLHDKIEDELASGAKLSEIADKLKLTYQTVDQVDRKGRKPDGSTITLPAQNELFEGGLRHGHRGRERSDRRQGRGDHLVRGAGRDAGAAQAVRSGERRSDQGLAHDEERTPGRQIFSRAGHSP